MQKDLREEDVEMPLMQIMEFELSTIAPNSSSRRHVHWKSDVKQPAHDILEPVSEVEREENERGTA